MRYGGPEAPTCELRWPGAAYFCEVRCSLGPPVHARYGGLGLPTCEVRVAQRHLLVRYGGPGLPNCVVRGRGLPTCEVQWPGAAYL